MARQFQLRRGTTADNETFVGAVAELTYDVQKKEVRVHDGSTPGGKVLGSGGGGGEVNNIDHITITKNSENEIQTEAVLNKNSNSTTTAIYDWMGTLQQYYDQDIERLHPEWVCYITDDFIDESEKPFNEITGYNIGDIFTTARLDDTLNGAVPCDGTTYDLTDFTGAENIGTLLIAGKLPYKSLATYASDLAANASVGYIGWDGPGTSTIKVPTLTDIFIESSTLAQTGDIIKAGLPNPNLSTAGAGGHSHTFSGSGGATGSISNIAVVSGATGAGSLSLSGQWDIAYTGGGSAHTWLQGAKLSESISTSLSGSTSTESDHTHTINIGNSTYGSASTVQPKAVRYRYMIQLVSGYTEEALLVGSTVLEELHHKVIAFQQPTVGNNYTWYRKYADGWVEQGGINAVVPGVGGVTITLPVVMSDANYTVLLTGNTHAGGTMVIDCFWCVAKRTSSFDVDLQSAEHSNYCDWQVAGMAA